MTPRSEAIQAEAIESAINAFIASAARPAILDPGEEPLLLIAGQWNLSQWNGRVVLEAWNGQRNLVRRINGLGEPKRDRLLLKIERFPRTPAELQIADLDAPLGLELERRATRIAFRDRFRLILAREHPAWKITDLSSEANLEFSLSPAWVRAFLRQGMQGIAVIAAPPDRTMSEDSVPFGLIWLDYLRRRQPDTVIRHLLICVPAGTEKETGLRVSQLNPETGEVQVIIYDTKDRAARLDLADIGNADSHLPPCIPPCIPPCVQAAGARPGLPDLGPDGSAVDRIPLSDGVVSLRVRGLEFARAAAGNAGKLTCGIGHRRRADIPTVRAFAREVARIRCPDSEDPQHPFFLADPESWLESAIRQSPELLDASLEGSPVYGQVPVFRCADRGVVDLLTVDHTGRLVVIEIKAAASIPLPFQALDYWLRVKKHREAGDLERQGYFPGITLRPEAPRIILAAPASEFHSTSEILLSSLRPGIECLRIGFAPNWRKRLEIVMRLRGAERPSSRAAGL